MDEIKNIVALFIKKNVEQISEDTLIDKTVINGSILIHRMYSTLANKGFIVKNYSNIKYFGQLLDSLNVDKYGLKPKSSECLKKIDSPSQDKKEINRFIKGIGIDVERTSNLPVVDDFRTDAFYLMNFTQSEISYCILKQNPIESFAGLFSIKEAIFKAGVKYNEVLSFNQIEISHSLTGAPFIDGYQISLSHTDDIVVAVAIAI